MGKMNLDKMQQWKQNEENEQPNCCLLNKTLPFISLLCSTTIGKWGTRFSDFFLIISSLDTKDELSNGQDLAAHCDLVRPPNLLWTSGLHGVHLPRATRWLRWFRPQFLNWCIAFVSHQSIPSRLWCAGFSLTHHLLGKTLEAVPIHSQKSPLDSFPLSFPCHPLFFLFFCLNISFLALPRQWEP